MFVVVSYDIPDNRRRLKVMKVMKLFGDHVQDSVFECNFDKDEMSRMYNRLSKIVDEKEDSVRIYTICAGCKAQIQVIGQGEVSEDPDLIII